MFLLSSCSSVENNQKIISISGEVELPLPISSNKFWINSGPLFVASQTPLITYRVIEKKEIKFIESNKSVHDFINSSFLNPKGISEESFAGSHNEYKLESRKQNDFSIHALTKPNESKAYITSKKIDFGIEILINGENNQKLIKQIITKVTLTTGK
jgi:hypothetical protein